MSCYNTSRWFQYIVVYPLSRPLLVFTEIGLQYSISIQNKVNNLSLNTRK